jgi:hypothetical protein
LSTDVNQPIAVDETKENLERKRNSIQAADELLRKTEDQPATPVDLRKRKSTGLFACFGSKKAKASSEQRGASTIAAPSALPLSETNVEQTRESAEEKPVVDYAIAPDGKRIYIDAFRDRPGLDMSYKPENFDSQFVLPIVRIDYKPICIC